MPHLLVVAILLQGPVFFSIGSCIRLSWSRRVVFARESKHPMPRMKSRGTRRLASALSVCLALAAAIEARRAVQLKRQRRAFRQALGNNMPSPRKRLFFFPNNQSEAEPSALSGPADRTVLALELDGPPRRRNRDQAGRPAQAPTPCRSPGLGE